ANCDGALQIPGAWLVDIRANGATAFRAVPTMHFDAADHSLTTKVPALFLTADYRADGIRELRAQMKTALMKAGLFDDEAERMLKRRHFTSDTSRSAASATRSSSMRKSASPPPHSVSSSSATACKPTAGESRRSEVRSQRSAAALRRITATSRARLRGLSVTT